MLLRMYPLLMIQIFLTLVFSATSFARNDVASEFQFVRLLDPYGMSLPAMIFEPDPEAENAGPTYLEDDVFYTPGTRFAFTTNAQLGTYGYIDNNNSLMPMIYVNPVDSDGTVDTTKFYGFPANFLEFESSGTNVYDQQVIRAHFESCDLSDNNMCDVSRPPVQGYTSEVFQRELVKTEQFLALMTRYQSDDLVSASAAEAAATEDDIASGDGPVETKIVASGPVVVRNDAPPVLGFGNLVERRAAEAAANEDAGSDDSNGSLEDDQSETQSGDEPAIDPTTVETQPAPLLTNPNNYFNNSNLRDSVVMSLKSSISDSYVRDLNTERSSNTFFQSNADLSAASRFILVPNVERKQSVNEDGQVTGYLRVVYGVDNSGNIFLDAQGRRAEFLIPETNLEYVDPTSSEVRVVSKDSKLMGSGATESAKLETQGLDMASETSADEVKPTDNPIAEPPVIPPAVKAPAVATQTPEQDDGDLDLAELTICSNTAFTKQQDPNSRCSLVEIENFKMVQSSLQRNLQNSVINQSIVIAVDNNSKMCSRISLSEEEFSDSSRHTQSLVEPFDQITTLFQSLGVKDRLGAAYLGDPQISKYTYSCNRDQSQCRFSYDHYAPETLKLNQDITMPSTNFATQKRIKVYGPDSENKYLVQFIVGTQVQRSVVLQNRPGLGGLTDGLVDDILDSMDDYNDLKSGDSSETKTGHFISSQTVDSDRQNVVQKERLGTPAALSLISRIRSNKTFYRMYCDNRSRLDSEVSPVRSSDTFTDQEGAE